MKSRVLFPFVLSAAVLLCVPGCKKDPQPVNIPTLSPKAYLPVYPGSSWTYATGNGDSLTWSTDLDYKIDHYTQADFSESANTRVPYLNGNPVYEYDRIADAPASAGVHYAKRWPLLREETGTKFERDFYDPQTPANQREQVVVLGKIPQLKLNGTTYDTVLVQRGFVWANVNQQLAPVYTCEYFARNIGLVWKTKIDTVSGDTLFNQKLLHYHIAH